MENMKHHTFHVPDDLKKVIAFHGHLCPGLIYGYRVAKEAMNVLGLDRSMDEEVVAICENDSCAVDALQVLLGTTAGKGNLIINNYGKNAYTILHRSGKKAYRFSRKAHYQYQGAHQDEFRRLDESYASGTATRKEEGRLKALKSEDLLSRPFEDVFSAVPVAFDEPPYAPLARSKACAECGEMTMSTKMVTVDNGRHLCVPCSNIS